MKKPAFAELTPLIEECRRRRNALLALLSRKSEQPVLIRQAQASAKKAEEDLGALTAARSARELAGVAADEATVAEIEQAKRVIQAATATVAALENDAKGFDGAIELLRADLSAAHDALTRAIASSTLTIMVEALETYRRGMQDLKDAATVLDGLHDFHTPRFDISVPPPDGDGHSFMTLPASPPALQIVSDIAPAMREANSALRSLLR